MEPYIFELTATVPVADEAPADEDTFVVPRQVVAEPDSEDTFTLPVKRVEADVPFELDVLRQHGLTLDLNGHSQAEFFEFVNVGYGTYADFVASMVESSYFGLDYCERNTVIRMYDDGFHFDAA